MKNDDLKLASEGDLEVVMLYENHSLLAEIISPNYYELLGDPPSEVRFNTRSLLLDFFVHVDELFSSARNNVNLDQQKLTLSLFEAAERFCRTSPAEAESAGLVAACARLRGWIDAAPLFSFWSGASGSQIAFNLSRREMIHFAANLHKHSLLHLGRLMARLRKLCESSCSLSNTEIIQVREPFIAELDSRLLYLSSWLVELLGAYFLAMNCLIVRRRDLAGTNDARRMPMPAATTSDSIRDLYASALVFQSYTAERITKHTPTVPEALKIRY